MIYTPRGKLTVIELSEHREQIAFEEIENVLWERPSNMIYVEVIGSLYGIISMGDVDRAVGEGKDYVNINTKFTSVLPTEYMRARDIFLHRTTINSLPIIIGGQLLGDYTRWDDLYRKGHLFPFSLGEYTSRFFEQYNHVALVYPTSIFEKKKSLFEKMKSTLEQYNVVVEMVDRKWIADWVDKVEKVLFVDEDELRGTCGLYRNFARKRFDERKCETYCQFANSIVDTIASVTLQNIQKSGVQVLAFGFDENEEGWLKWLYEEIDTKYRIAGVKKENILLPQWKQAFLEEVYDEIYEKQSMPFPLSLHMRAGMRVLDDCENSLFHLEQGERVTTGQPQKYEHCIHIYGPCIVLGPLVEDRHTIASFLQERVNRAGMSYKVINHGMPGFDMQAVDKITTTSFRKGDIIIIDRHRLKLRDVEDINIVDILSTKSVPAQWFTDQVRHCNYKVNELIADELFNKVLAVQQKCDEKDEFVETRNDFVLQHYIKRYFGENDVLTDKTVGAIVMNCNPFTYGHRYLIEEACKIVDLLIIFVVEENQSLFSFAERFAMVCEGTSDLEKVMVVPSGEYILSSATFPEYFVKKSDEDLIENIEADVKLFAERISPALNISYRFVGEEPEDGVTNEYNMAMKRILPSYGIEVIEIPRKKQGTNVISASSVRKCLEENDWNSLDELVPESTREILYKVNL